MLPQTDCNVTQGLPFCTAFLFLPGGTQLFTGSLDHIRKRTDCMPTCHGVVRYHANNRVKPLTAWDLFGKLHRFQRPFIDMKHAKIYRTQSTISSHDLFADDRRRHIIVLYLNNHEPILVGRWRKMPNQYLRQFHQLDETYVT